MTSVFQFGPGDAEAVDLEAERRRREAARQVFETRWEYLGLSNGLHGWRERRVETDPVTYLQKQGAF